MDGKGWKAEKTRGVILCPIRVEEATPLFTDWLNVENRVEVCGNMRNSTGNTKNVLLNRERKRKFTYA